MARVIMTKYIPKFGFKIVNHLSDGTQEVNTFFKGDTIASLRYVKDEAVKSVSGKIVDIDIYFAKATNKVAGNRKSYLTSDAKVVSVTIDHSTKNNSAVDVIDAREILDYEASEEVVKVSILPTVVVDFEVKLSDGSKSEATFEEGQKYYGMTLLDLKGTEVTDNYTVPAFAYTADAKGKGDIYGIIVDNGNVARAISFLSIKTTGLTPVIIDDPEAAVEALTNIEEDAILDIRTDVEIESTIEIPEGVSVILNLNDNAIIVPEPVNNRSLYAIDNYGDLTIEGGTISARGIENFGKMTINDIDLTNRDTNGGAALWNEGDLVINGGIFKTTYEGTVQASSGPGCLNNRGNCTINKGTFKSVNNRCYTIISSGDIEIPDGTEVTVNGAHGGLAIDSGHAVINGGVYTSTNFYGLYVSNDGTGTPEKAQVIVNGGSFTGKVTSVYIGSDSGRPVDSIIDINGGIFNNKLVAQSNVIEGAGIKVYGGFFKEYVTNEYCAPGYICTDEPNEEGFYTIIPEPPVNEEEGPTGVNEPIVVEEEEEP